MLCYLAWVTFPLSRTKYSILKEPSRGQFSWRFSLTHNDNSVSSARALKVKESVPQFSSFGSKASIHCHDLLVPKRQEGWKEKADWTGSSGREEKPGSLIQMLADVVKAKMAVVRSSVSGTLTI